MSVLVTVVSFIFVLGILVFFHELGHYLAARRSGIIVEEFGMGYPPRLARLFNYQGTEFTLNLLPFGGFARMKGEDAGDMSPGSFNAASRKGRAFTLFAGPAMNLLLAVVLFAVSFMVGGSEVLLAYPQIAGAPNAAATAIGLEQGDILVSAGGAPTRVNGIPNDPLATVWKAPGREPVELVVVRGGQPVTLGPVAPRAVSQFLAERDGYVPVASTRIDLTAPDSPAEAAGVQAGDLIYAVNDTVVTLDLPLSDLVSRHLGEELVLSVLREDTLLDLAMTPRANPPAGQGALGVQIGAVTQFATLPFFQSIWQGVVSTARYILLVLELPARLLMGQVAPEAAQVSGPVGIAREVGSAVSSSIDYGVFWPILRLSAVLSAALAITNLLPLPALDGGRLLFIFIEAIRGRRVDPAREGFVHMIGFMLLLSLLVIITVRDITAPHQTIDWGLLLGQ